MITYLNFENPNNLDKKNLKKMSFQVYMFV